ncbi:type II toxin-antitoxin system CcdA family antitoxin [Streptomyces sp. SP18BB07]|uniref:type II toxin-antitoxin system CcdA family antitoxin n=1 Tax=Streptomyces sp. SP18BB07 TaxID=3002522 RepID=UPI002E769992|nr:type II toxin-antitoxin system CcdA family antitoxin [Streptomyces sp. SP18BB07]MEE1764449.1 hypothetical protein [Streptomyces sp. SP18BB07]
MTTPQTPARSKVSVTLPQDLEQRAKAAGGKNFSAYVEQALEEKLLADSMLEYRRLRQGDSLDDVYEAIEADLEDAA